MLNYNSDSNLLKGLISNNSLASMLYENIEIKMTLLKFLKQTTIETGKLPRERYNTLYEALDDAIGSDIDYRSLINKSESYFNSKKG